MTKTKKQRRKKKRQKLTGGDRPRCGLCGATGKLRRTECCGNWICDDYDKYVLFTYARNSCSRNHDHYTLCAHHHIEGHGGSWKICPVCRDEFEAEFYGWLGTNEYNFEKLLNPPPFEPKHCVVCGRRIRLGTDGYTFSGENEYRCEDCMEVDLREFGEAASRPDRPPLSAYRERPHVFVAGPPGAGKTTFIERVLESNRVRDLVAVRCRERADVEETRIPPDDNAETEAFADAGSADEILVHHPPGGSLDTGPVLFLVDLHSPEIHGLLVELDGDPGYPADYHVFVTRPLPPGESLFERREVREAALPRELYEEVKTQGILPDEVVSWLEEEFAGEEELVLETNRWALRETHRWLAPAHLVLINIQSEAERPEAERLAAEIRRMQNDPDLCGEIYAEYDRPRRRGVRIVNLADPKDAELRKAVRLVKGRVPNVPARPRGCPHRPARKGPPRRYLRLMVKLLGFGRRVWREIHMPQDASFWELHVALAGALGEDDLSSHRFEIRLAEEGQPLSIGIVHPDASQPEIPSWSVCLTEFLPRSGTEFVWYGGEAGDRSCEVTYEGSFPAFPTETYPLVVDGEDEDDEFPFQPAGVFLQDPVAALRELYRPRT